MNDRPALLAGIRDNWADDLARLVYADWLEERLPSAARVLAEVRREIEGRRPKDPAQPPIHGIAYWLATPEMTALQERAAALLAEVGREADRDAATAEFIRLTCGLPAPKRAKTRKCPLCQGTKRDPGLSTPETFHGCPRCKAEGRVPVPEGTYRLFPPKAAEWLKANWRRLVPKLTADWDRKVPVMPGRLIGEGPHEVADSLFSDAWGSAEVRRDRWDRWVTRRELDCGVPFVLPLSEAWGGGEAVYPCRVNLRFDRGFLEIATWRAPQLGPLKIQPAITEDQPLAWQYGPGALCREEHTAHPLYKKPIQ